MKRDRNAITTTMYRNLVRVLLLSCLKNLDFIKVNGNLMECHFLIWSCFIPSFSNMLGLIHILKENALN